ncbi:MAG: DUF1616 domain-containing protein, partial [Methanomassiliicoccales archaeon]|nr:DUF1616 domain-containing protein [Methanomassiliicoccales archaeon]
VTMSAIAVGMGLGGVGGHEPYTEFYITGPGGDISRLPSVLGVGENGTVMMNIVNHEGRPTNYNLTLGLSNDSSFGTLNALNWEGDTSLAPEEGHYAQIGLQDDGSVELNFTFSVGFPGEYRLYFQIRNGDSLKELWIWLEIIVPD